MPVFYVRSTDGNNADDGSTWALAKATLAGAFAAASAGDTIYLSHAHAESTAANMVLTSPGTVASPCKVICINDSTGALADTAVVQTNGNYYITFAGFVYCYGVSFTAGSGGDLNTALINFSSTNPWAWVIENGLLYLNTTSTTVDINIGAAAGGDDELLLLIDTDIRLGDEAQSINIRHCKFEWRGGVLVCDETPTASVFAFSINTYTAIFFIHGVDLSSAGTGPIVNVSHANIGKLQISNCKMAASWVETTGTIAGPGGIEAYFDNCDSGDPSSGPRSSSYTYQGSVKTDTAIVRTGGASDGTAYSLKMTANSTGVSFISPLVTRPIPKAIDTVGSEITVTAHIAMEEGATPLTESQCWMEVEYMGTSGSTKTSFATDHNSSVIAESSTDQTTSTETWTGFTGTPVKQKLSVAFTPQEKGFYMVRIYLARPAAATTAPPVYICPKLVVS